MCSNTHLCCVVRFQSEPVEVGFVSHFDRLQSQNYVVRQTFLFCDSFSLWSVGEMICFRLYRRLGSSLRALHCPVFDGKTERFQALHFPLHACSWESFTLSGKLLATE